MNDPSAFRRVSSERVVLLGWSRAILLQLAHPLVAAGVADHSDFKGGVLQAARRLHATVGAMLSLTFGDPEQREAALNRIRTIHRSVHGTLTEPVGPFRAGARYSAEDPALLLWVHATLVESSADIYQRLVAPLTPAALDALCDEAVPTLLDLGGDPKTAPRTWPALVGYMTTVLESGLLATSPRTRALADGVLSPRAARIPVPLGGPNRLITIGLLPPSVRAIYGYQWSPARERRFLRTLSLIRTARRLAPDALALWPQAR